MRLKLGKGRAERRTYAATTDKDSHITLFKEISAGETLSDPSSATHKLTGSKKPVVFLGVAHEKIGPSGDNLIVVKADGEMQCFDGQDLSLKWTSPAAAVSKNSTTPDIQDNKVELVTMTDAYTASRGLLKSHPDAFSMFTEEIEAEGFNPTLVIAITSPTDARLAEGRTLHVFALPRVTEPFVPGHIHSAQALISLSIPWVHSRTPALLGELQYELHVGSGLLYELAGRTLTIIDLTESTPKTKSQLIVDNISSFLRLSTAAVMAATKDTVDIYNPTYQSIQASIELEHAQNGAGSRKRKLEDEENTLAIKLVSYSPKHNLAHAIIGSDLVAFAIEAKKDTASRRRALGLLVDSLGCSVRDTPAENAPKLRQIGLSSLQNYIPGTKSVSDKELKEKFSQLDRFVASQDINAFEEVMAKELGIKREETAEAKAVPAWIWPANRKAYPDVDPRWAQYALGRIFSWSTQGDEAKLLVVFYPHNVVNWLLETGNLNKPAIQSALKHEAHGAEVKDIPAGQLVSALVDIDHEMKTLLSFLQHNFLDAAELVHAIRILMESLGIFGDQAAAEKQLLLTNGEGAAADNADDVEAEVEMQTLEADAALRLAEYRLGDGATVRDQALSLALAKLHACPPKSVVLGFKEHLSVTEIVSIVYLLRYELARGSWTSRYLDGQDDTPYDLDEERGTQDSTIVLISSLVNACIDAIGSNGWVANASGEGWHPEELISNLKLEISAALEGIEEATYLRGLMAEMVRYGQAVQKAQPVVHKRRKANAEKVNVPVKVDESAEAAALPFGLKVEGQVSLMKVGAGGEIMKRSARDIGQLKSRKVAKYSRERIAI